MDKYEAFLASRVRILEHIVEGGSVLETLEMLCLETEATDPDVRCSVQYYDQEAGCLRHAAAPSMPSYYNKAVDGLQVGMGVGSCGTAAFTGERVIVEDVFTHPYWEPFRDLAKRVGFKASWSQPIYSKGKRVLGTFAMYYEDVKAPNEGDLQLIQGQANLASLAIERQNAEDLLNQSETKNRALLEGSPICNKIIDMDSRLRYMSAAGIKMLKIPDISTYYGGTYPPDFYDDAMRAPMVKHLEIAKAGGISEVECPLYSTEGDEVWLHTTFVPALNKQGEVDFVIATSVDITDRKKAEVAAQKSKIEAQQANQAKSEFLANMSHDLRTPLNAIIGFTEMMETETFGPLGDPKYEEYTKDIRHSGNLLVSLINDILDISKIEAGKYELADENLDIADLINGSVKMLSTLSKAGELEIVMEVEADMPQLRADQRSITQILNNLLSNAVKFTGPGGRITVRGGVGEDAIQLSVEDTGIGMSKDGIEKVFIPFEQVGRKTTEPRNGTGLGLHLCQKLVQLHGGDITLQSQLGAGTTVAIRFPSERTVR